MISPDRLLGLEVELVTYTRVAEVLDGVKQGNVDFTITNATVSRAKDVDFMPNLLSIEVGYLVPSGSSLLLMQSTGRVSASELSRAALPKQTYRWF